MATKTLTNRKPAANVPLVQMANGRHVVAYTLADPEVQDQLDAYVVSITATPEAALGFLRDAGILTGKGKYTKPLRDLAAHGE